METHYCIGANLGSKIIMFCPLCGYERHYDLLTKETTVYNFDPRFEHVGELRPVEPNMEFLAEN